MQNECAVQERKVGRQACPGKISGPWVISILALVLAALSFFQISPQPYMERLDNILSHPTTGKEQRSDALAQKNQERGRHAFASMFGDDQDLIADVATQLAPSVVNIDVARHEKVYYQEFSDIFRFFFGDEGAQGSPGPGGGATRVIAGSGSGVIIDREGHILTNSHVVAKADEILVTLNDKRRVPARLVGMDRYSDLAVLKIDAKNLVPAILGDSGTLRPGQWVIAVGSPLGFDHTVTLGIVSALSRDLPDINRQVSFIQTDAAINPGNSGGPLVNLRGEVVGINTAVSGMAQNIGFSIPISDARQIVDSLLRDGKVARAYVGISVAQLTPEMAQQLGVPEHDGVVVAGVMSGSPAAGAGLQQGDLILSINGQPVSVNRDVQHQIQAQKPGTTFSLGIRRGNDKMTLRVKTALLPDNLTR
ncbi:MAG: S1C family serine protease [Candidatus Melainabacteria bacterium]